MKKLLAILLVVLMMGAVAVGCSSKEEGAKTNQSADQKDSPEKLEIRFGIHLADDHSLTVAAKKFAEIVAKNSDGRIDVKVFPNGTLGGQREMIEGMQMGTIEMSINDPGLMSNFAPKMAVLDLPYTFKDYAHVRKVLDGEVGTTLADELLAQNVRLLAWTDSAFRDVLVNKKITKVADLKGVKLRTPEAPAYFKTVEGWGAIPTAIPWGDAYTAIQTDVVQGMEGSAESVFTAKMHEVTKYLVRTNHIYTAVSFNISEKFFSGLSKEDQELIQAAAKEAAQFGRELAESRDSEYRQKLIDGGMEESKVDIEEFKAAVKPARDAMVKELGVTDLDAKIAAAAK